MNVKLNLYNLGKKKRKSIPFESKHTIFLGSHAWCDYPIS